MARPRAVEKSSVSRRSLDNLVCEQQQRLRDRQPKRLGRLEIENEFELRRLFHGQVPILLV